MQRRQTSSIYSQEGGLRLSEDRPQGYQPPRQTQTHDENPFQNPVLAHPSSESEEDQSRSYHHDPLPLRRSQTEATPSNRSSAPSNTTSARTLVDPSSLEQVWHDFASTPSGGQRTLLKPKRGVVTFLTNSEEIWLEHVQSALGYIFQNPDLLEEALESPGSGVLVVGRTNRVCGNGNEGLARVGQAVMKLVLRDQCYLFGLPEKDLDMIVERIIGLRNLDKVGRRSKIESMIRPRAPVRPTRRHNILSLMKEDLRAEWPVRTIARGMKAIIGATYYDGGFDAARRVMVHLNLIIRPGG